MVAIGPKCHAFWRERKARLRVEGKTQLRKLAMPRTLALLALLGLVACETVQGAGRDLETAGEVIQNEAQETQSGM